MSGVMDITKTVAHKFVDVINKIRHINTFWKLFLDSAS